MSDLILVVLKSSIVYFFIIFAIRLFGKKELAQLSIIDLVFILLISNSVQNAMVGSNVSLLAGLAAATTLFTINYALKFFMFRSKKLSSFIQGNPLMLIYGGQIIQEHLEQSKVSQQELEAAVREHGVENISQVDLAVLEVDGNISVLSQNFQRKTVKKIRANKIIAKTS